MRRRHLFFFIFFLLHYAVIAFAKCVAFVTVHRTFSRAQDSSEKVFVSTTATDDTREKETALVVRKNFILVPYSQEKESENV